jgi:MFS superfamily sulfate permease-like transporter
MTRSFSLRTLPNELTAGLVVFLVALPLCLGVALASGAPLFSGIIAGVIGGLVVGLLSGSPLSVSGPAAGLTAIVATNITDLGSFENFLAALAVCGVLQLILGLSRAGSIAAFFPSSVIKGLLAAIGVLLILKQIPHAVGHDPDPEGEMSFFQTDNKNTFTELASMLEDFQPGALVVGVSSVLLLLVWNKVSFLRKTAVPAPLAVVLLGILANEFFLKLGDSWSIDSTHVVDVPAASGWTQLQGFFHFPNLSAFQMPAVYTAGLTLALVASLETLLSLEAVDKLDPLQRSSPPNRELIAQGIGNIVAGLVGGVPLTTSIVHGSVNVNAGAKTKLSTVLQGGLLLAAVALAPVWLKKIPIASLAAILIVTGVKLANPFLFRQMWREGRSQFVPFLVTVMGIVLTDLPVGILLGAATSIGFILRSNFIQPLHRVVERHVSGEVLRIALPNQVSFFKRAGLEKVLREVPRGGHVLLDARTTNYIDPDVLDLIEDFGKTVAPAHGVRLSKIGFKEGYHFEDDIQFIDYSSREAQSALTPKVALEILRAGNERFCSGHRIERDLTLQRNATADGQFPMAVIFSCIDSRTPVEMVFDLGLGDVFSVRIAGNIARDKVLGSMEYSCAVAGAKLLLVMGHSSCGAVGAAINLFGSEKSVQEATGCGNLDGLISELQKAVEPHEALAARSWQPAQRAAYSDTVAKRNVLRTVRTIREKSRTLDTMVREQRLAIVAAFQDVKTGKVTFYQTADSGSMDLELPRLEDELSLAPSVTG